MAFEGRYRETQRGGGFGSGATSAEPVEDDTATALQELERDLVTFRGCVEGIGTQFDDHENRKQIKKMRSVIKSKVTSTQANLKSGKRSNPQSKIILDRQSAQLDKQINLFQSLLEKEKAMIKQNPQPSSAVGGGGGDSPEDNTRESVISPTNQSQALSQVQRMGGLEEREQEAEELQQLETDILDLRDIHQEVAGMVNEQGKDIDRIDKNISIAATRVESGTKQTKIAVELKKKGTRIKLIIIAVIVAVVIAIIVILAILLGIFIPRGKQ